MASGGDLDNSLNLSQLPDGSTLGSVATSMDYRLRVANTVELVNGLFRFGASSIDVDSGVAGGGSVAWANNSELALTTTVTSGSSAFAETRPNISYLFAAPVSAVLGVRLGTATANVRKRVGVFNVDDGFFFEQTGAGMSVVRRSSVSGSAVDTVVAQASWNLDRLDGTGPSGVTFDPTKYAAFVIDFIWFGGAILKFGVYVGDKIVYCHRVDLQNTETVPMSRVPDVPGRVEVTNTALAASGTTIALAGISIKAEADYRPRGTLRYLSSGVTGKAVLGSGIITPIISVRKTATRLNVPMELCDLGVFVTSVDDVEWMLYSNATLTGAVFAASGNGNTEIDTTATALTPVGGILAGGYIRANTATASVEIRKALDSRIPLILGKVATGGGGGAASVLTLAARNVTSASVCFGWFNIRELNSSESG